MIENDLQYKITKEQAERFRQALKDYDDRSDIPFFTRAERKAMESVLADLEEQMAEYEVKQR